MVGLDDFGEQADDAERGVELAAALALGHRELGEEVFIDAPKGVVVGRDGDLGHLFEELLEEGAAEDGVGLGEDTGELGVLLLDGAHGVVDLGTDVGGLGQVEQVVEAGLGGQVEHALGVVCRRILGAVAAPRGDGGTLTPGPSPRGRGEFELCALEGKTGLGEAQKNEAEDGRGVFGGFQAGVGPELVGGGPELFFKRGRGGVFLRGGDPLHAKAKLP